MIVRKEIWGLSMGVMVACCGGQMVHAEEMLNESVEIRESLQSGREWLIEQGVEFEVNISIDYSRNLMGGVSTSKGAFRSLADVGISFDMKKLCSIEGATFFIDVQSINGDDGSEVLTGDAQAFSNIDFSDNRTQISEAWWEQVLDEEGHFAIKIGKIDVNADFAFVDYGGEFINSSAGFSPTIMGLPTYPETAFGGAVYMRATDEQPYYACLGVFDGSNMSGIRTGLRGPNSFLDNQDQLYVIGEGGMNWRIGEGLPGRLGVGFWRFTGDVDRLDGGREDGTDGMYLVLDQVLYREDASSDQGLDMFGMFGYADDEVAEINQHIAIGCVYTGLIAGRESDACGLMGTWAGFSDDANKSADGEFAAELFYKLVISDWLSVKPDLQWIANPGGDEGKDALVATVRTEFSF